MVVIFNFYIINFFLIIITIIVSVLITRDKNRIICGQGTGRKCMLVILSIVTIYSIWSSPQHKVITFQFDDGPTENTVHILEILKRYGIRAVFCVVGSKIKIYPEYFENIVRNGHVICNHSYSHRRLNELPYEEIRKELRLTNHLIRKYGYKGSIFYFPPFASFDKNYTKAVFSLHHSKLILPSIGLYRYEIRSPDILPRLIIKAAKKGVTHFLLHVHTRDKLYILDKILNTLLKKGYKINPDKKNISIPYLSKNYLRNTTIVDIRKGTDKHTVKVILNAGAPYFLEFLDIAEKYHINKYIVIFTDVFNNFPYIKMDSNELVIASDKCNNGDEITYFKQFKHTQSILFNLGRSIASKIWYHAPKNHYQ